jgi:nitrate reductase gamma subunit
MTLDQVLHLACYALVVVFAIVVVRRFLKIAKMPLHLRWELYPVAHEKGRAHYGGSYFEELDWWTKPRQTSMLGELKVMVPEILLLEGVRHHNKGHWARTFPFHFGLYLVIFTTMLLLLGGILTALGVSFGARAGAFANVVAGITTIAGYAGIGLVLVGGLALLHRRLTDEEYKDYTNPVDTFNLVFFLATFGLVLLAHLTGDPGFARAREFFAGLITFGGHAPALGMTPLLAVSTLLLGLLLAYIPMTHMSHFFTKWFMYHSIRWSDEPLTVGGKIESQVHQALEQKPTWSAPHIGADGKKNWVDIATTMPEDEEGKSA